MLYICQLVPFAGYWLIIGISFIFLWICQLPSKHEHLCVLCVCLHANEINIHLQVSIDGIHKNGHSFIQLSLDSRKPVFKFAACEQQRRRSACTSAQSDQHLCYSLSG